MKKKYIHPELNIDMLLKFDVMAASGDEEKDSSNENQHMEASLFWS